MDNSITQPNKRVENTSPDKKSKQNTIATNGAHPEEATPVDTWDAPEENNVSEIPNDPRPSHQVQPPTKEQF